MMNPDDLIKKIDEKIAQLEKEENPNELLKRALLKKGIISKEFVMNEDKLETLFELLKKEINR